MTTQTIFFIILAILFALGISFFQYYFNAGKRTKKWGWFAFLRFVSLFCLFLLLINPKFEQKTYILEKPSLVLAVDNSTSIANLGKSMEVRNFVSGLKNNSKLTERYDIDVFSFGERFTQTDSLSFSENQTQIGEALRSLSRIYKGKTAPVVLITDGNQTYGQNYVYTAKRYDQPIFPVVVGDTAQYVDLKIEQINVNRYVFLNNEFPIEIFVNYSGTENVSSDFILKQGKSIVFRKQLEFSAKNTSEIITAKLPAKSVGVHTFSAVIKALEHEKNKVNNQKNFAIEVIDQKTNVLMIAGILHPDIGALKKAIESNPQRTVTIKKSSDEIDFGKYQLVILYQPNRSFKQAYSRIEALNLNTFTITGTATDYRFLNSVQSDFKKNTNYQTESYLPVFNKNYSIFQLENIGFVDFPPLKDKFGSLDFKSVPHPILFQNINGFSTETPLLATMENDAGQRKAYLFGEGIWKWRAQNYVERGSFNEFDTFLSKLVQYLASTKKRSRLELIHDSFYKQGEQVIIEASYFDENYVFDPRAKLTLNAKNSTSDKTIKRPFLLKNNSYKVNLSDLSPGNYSFTVRVENQNLSKSGEFTLVEFDVENQFVNANFEKLQQIASNKSHQVYFLKNPENLINDLMNNNAFKPIQKSSKKMTTLIDWYYLLGIIVLALSTEWFMRKYRGLV